MHPYSESDFDDEVVQRTRHSERAASGRPSELVESLGPLETPVEKKRPETGFAVRLFWFATMAVIVMLIWQMIPKIVENYQYAATRGRIRAEYENAVLLLKDNPLENVSNAYELVAQKIRPSVVSIQTTVPNDAFSSPRLEQQSSGPRRLFPPESSSGQGSGVIISSEGHILTNAHVLKGAEKISIILHDRRSYLAKRVGKSDTLNDLAVLKIDAPDLVAAEWGNSDALHVGSIVWAIGSPFGYDQTVTSGIISAKNRVRKLDGQQMNGHQQMLQTDAAVNPGNSGGPLVNSQGQVVGINTAIHGKQFQGISFAVPSTVARYVYEQTVANGFVARSVLGVYVDAVYQEHARRYNLPDINGARITRVVRPSPASVAGIRRGDVIRSWNGQPIQEYAMLYRFVDMTEPHTKVTLTVYRNGSEHDVDVVVAPRPENAM